MEDAYEAEAAAAAAGSRPKLRLDKAKFLDRRGSRAAAAAAQGRQHAMRLRQKFQEKSNGRQQALGVQAGGSKQATLRIATATSALDVPAA